MKNIILTLILVMLSACQVSIGKPPVTGEPPVDPCAEVVVQEAHVWVDYHLPEGSLNIRIDDQRSPEAIQQTPINYKALNGMQTQLTFSATKGDFVFKIKEDGDPASGWLGLAQIQLLGSHIISATVSMNTSLLQDYADEVLAHVLTQELLHLVGLGHQRQAVPPSAMDDCQGRAGYSEWLACLSDPLGVGPNQHDIDQIIKIYLHVEDPPVPGNPPAECAQDLTIHATPAIWNAGSD